MSFGGVDLVSAVALFGWIPFWWGVALVTLYRMRRNDERNGQDDRGVETL